MKPILYVTALISRAPCRNCKTKKTFKFPRQNQECDETRTKEESFFSSFLVRDTVWSTRDALRNLVSIVLWECCKLKIRLFAKPYLDISMRYEFSEFSVFFSFGFFSHTNTHSYTVPVNVVGLISTARRLNKSSAKGKFSSTMRA